MAKYRFVWRKIFSEHTTSKWHEKHVIATNAEMAVSQIGQHLHAKTDNVCRIELDHLFFEIGNGGLHGHDRKDFTLLSQFKGPDRVFVEQHIPGVTVVSS